MCRIILNYISVSWWLVGWVLSAGDRCSLTALEQVPAIINNQYVHPYQYQYRNRQIYVSEAT